MKTLTISILLLASTLNSFAQIDTSDMLKPSRTLLKIISGPKEKIRDWDLFTKQFVQDASISAMMADRAGEKKVIHLDVATFVRKFGPGYSRQDFFEDEIQTPTVQIMEESAIVMQPYAGRFSEDGPQEMQGVNVYTMVLVNDEWKINYLFWEDMSTEAIERLLDENQ